MHGGAEFRLGFFSFIIGIVLVFLADPAFSHDEDERKKLSQDSQACSKAIPTLRSYCGEIPGARDAQLKFLRSMEEQLKACDERDLPKADAFLLATFRWEAKRAGTGWEAAKDEGARFFQTVRAVTGAMRMQEFQREETVLATRVDAV